MTIDYDNPGTQVKRPASLAHVVLRTNNLKPMTEFYKTFLGAHVAFSNDVLSFLSYDDEHHRIAIYQGPNTGPKQPDTCGLHHIAFAYRSLEDLALSYRQRKANGFLPFWCVNHGVTTSMYYRDPDGNEVEMQVDNFETSEEADAWMRSGEFERNPVGTDFEAEDLVSRLKAGEDGAEIKKRVEIGVRSAP